MSSPVVLRVSVKADGTAVIDDLGKKMDKLKEKGSLLKSVFGGMLTSMLVYNVFTMFTTKIHESIDEILKFNKTMTTTEAIFQSADKIIEKYIKTKDGALELNPEKRGIEGVHRQIEAIKDYVIELSNTMEFSAATLSNAALSLTKMGMPLEETKAVIATVSNLATTTGTDLTEALTGAIQISRSFGLELGDVNKACHTMATTVLSTEDTFQNYMEAMKMVAPVAHSLGVSLEEASLYIGALGNLGLRGTMGGTALKNMLLDLLKPSKDVKEAMQGIDMEGMTLYKILMIIKEKGVSVLGFLNTFNLRAIPGVLGLINTLPKAIDTLFEKIKKSGMNVNDIAKQIRTSWTDQMAILKNNLINVGVEFSRIFETLSTNGAFNGVLVFLQQGQKWIRVHYNEIRETTQNLINNVLKYGKIIVSFGKEIWTAIKIVFAVSAINLFMGGLAGIVGMIGKIFTAFKGLSGLGFGVFASLTRTVTLATGALGGYVAGLILINYWENKLNEESDKRTKFGGSISGEDLTKRADQLKTIKNGMQDLDNFIKGKQLEIKFKSLRPDDWTDKALKTMFFKEKESYSKYKKEMSDIFDDLSKTFTEKLKNFQDEKSQLLPDADPELKNKLDSEIQKLTLYMYKIKNFQDMLSKPTFKDDKSNLEQYKIQFSLYKNFIEDITNNYYSTGLETEVKYKKLDQLWLRVRDAQEKGAIDFKTLPSLKGLDIMAFKNFPINLVDSTAFLDDIDLWINRFELSAGKAAALEKSKDDVADAIAMVKKLMGEFASLGEIYGESANAGDTELNLGMKLTTIGKTIEVKIQDFYTQLQAGFMSNSDLQIPMNFKVDPANLYKMKTYIPIIMESIKDTWSSTVKKFEGKELQFPIFQIDKEKITTMLGFGADLTNEITKQIDINNDLVSKLILENLNIYAEMYNQIKEKTPEIADSMKKAMQELYKLLIKSLSGDNELGVSIGATNSNVRMKKIVTEMEKITKQIVVKEKNIFQLAGIAIKEHWKKLKDDVNIAVRENPMEALKATDILKTEKLDKVVEVTGKLFGNIWKAVKIAYQTSKSGIKNIFNLFMDDILDPKTGEKTGKKTISSMIDTFIKSEAMQTVFSGIDMVGNAISARIDALNSLASVELENMQKTHETELTNLDEFWEKKKSYVEGDAELTALYDRRQSEAKKVLLAKQKAEEDEYRKKQQGYAIAQALINGALAVTNILANMKPIFWAFAIPFSIATTALQIKAIKAQTFAGGGLVNGRDNGIDTIPARLTVGEYIVNKRIVDASGGAQGIERKLNNDTDYISNKYKQGQIILNVGTFVGNKLWVNSFIDEIRKELPRRI